MTDYLSFQFNDTPDFISTFDEQPLWSAYFGILLLKHIELKPDMTVLDLGSGAGFPLLELAERLGSSCKCYGLDPWTNANTRARQKIRDYNISNVEIIDGSATQIPFGDKSIDLIISNLGVNNFDDAQTALHECRRVLKPGGKLVITTNLNGHWKEFYDVFQRTLEELNEPDLVSALIAQQEHRGTIATIRKRLGDSGLKLVRHFEEPFTMRFLNGSAFLRHHFVKVGWLASWRDLIPEEKRMKVFERLEENLNSYAKKNGGLALTVPAAYVEAG
jgi:ubiquinone/menaquinone biosynthesis C-methylase UbiE